MFNKFIQNTPLTLRYTVPNIDDYYINIELTALSKSEISENKRLVCDITLTKTSLWYKNVEIETTEVISNNNKIYTYKYPYKYVENTASKILLNNNGDVETPLRIEIIGSVQIPTYFVKYNNSLIGNCIINCHIPKGHKLVIDSSFITPEITEYTISNEYVQNLYLQSDFTTTRFIKIPKGQSIFSFTSSSTRYPQLKISFREYYATV